MGVNASIRDRLGHIRLIVSDLDGTLVNSSDTISSRSAQALEDAKREGYLLSLFTGRPLRGLDRVYPIIKPNAPVAGSNGAQVASADRTHLYQETTLDPDALRSLVAFVFDEGLDFTALGSDDVLINANPRHPLVELSRSENPGLIDPFGGLKHVSAANDPLIGSFGVVKFNVELGNSMDKELERVIEYVDSDPRLSYTVAGEGLFEVVPASASKGAALLLVCELIGISPLECIYFGEYENDISAFRCAGIAVCMENGSAAAKANADCICKTNDEDGVADFLETYLLRR